MGLFDNWSWSDTWSALGTAANVAGAGYDIYQGYQNQQLANKYADIAFSTAEKQDEYAQAMFDRMKNLYWPYEDLNYQYATEDLQTLRPLGQAQAQYAVERGLSDIAQQRELDSVYYDTEKSLIRKLTEGEDVLADRLMQTATANVANAYAQQRESDARKLSASGINPNSGQYANYMNRMGSQQAMAEATARTQASRQAEDLAISRQSQALNYRQGAQLPTYQTTPSVNASNITSGLSSSGSMSGSLYNDTSQQAQLGFSSAYSLLKNLTSGSSI